MKIKIELEINDKLWADFCFLIEDFHKNCCKQSPNQYIQQRLSEYVIQEKMNSLIDSVDTKELTIDSIQKMLQEKAEELANQYKD